MYRLDRVRMSMRAQSQLGQLKSRTGLPINVLARFGICMSLADETVPNPDLYDEKGMELLPHILFGEHEAAYAAALRCRLDEDGLDFAMYADRMMRAHLDRGAGMLFPRVRGLGDFAALLGCGEGGGGGGPEGGVGNDASAGAAGLGGEAAEAAAAAGGGDSGGAGGGGEGGGGAGP